MNCLNNIVSFRIFMELFKLNDTQQQTLLDVMNSSRIEFCFHVVIYKKGFSSTTTTVFVVLVSETRKDVILVGVESREDLRANRFALVVGNRGVIETAADVEDVVVELVALDGDLDRHASDLAGDPAQETRAVEVELKQSDRNHAKKVTQTRRIVNIFRTLFFTFFRVNLDGIWTFALDNLENVKKNRLKNRDFFRKKSLTRRAEYGRLIVWGEPPLPPPPYLYTLYYYRWVGLYYYNPTACTTTSVSHSHT